MKKYVMAGWAKFLIAILGIFGLLLVVAGYFRMQGALEKYGVGNPVSITDPFYAAEQLEKARSEAISLFSIALLVFIFIVLIAVIGRRKIEVEAIKCRRCGIELDSISDLIPEIRKLHCPECGELHPAPRKKPE